MPTFIPVNEPLLNGNEKKYLNECIDSGWISSEGPFVGKLETQFAERVSREYGVAVCNGSAALDIAVKALNIGKGDEVIFPTFTIISCAAAIVRSGAVPVLVDSDPITWNMDVNQIEAKITPRTKAIMVVHIYGLPVDMDTVLMLAQKYNLRIIEDAAEMHGQYYKDKPCGSFGDISIFSFYPNKHVTTGEGGILVTNEEHLAARCRAFRDLCFIKERRFKHEELGWNNRMSNLQAAVGVAQLERLDEFIVLKREMGKLYTSILSGCNKIQIPQPSMTYSENIYWVFGLVLDENLGINAQLIMKELGDRGIGTRPFFYPMHLQPVFNKMGLFNGESYPVAERIAEQGFYLPSGLTMNKEKIEICANTLLSVLSEK